jgi:hypothetical protein
MGLMQYRLTGERHERLRAPRGEPKAPRRMPVQEGSQRLRARPSRGTG